MGYQTSMTPSGAIGTLLRTIAEQKTETPIIAPSKDTGSPIRDVVQQPLSNPESPGTNQVISIKPEAAGGLGTNAVESGAPQRSSIGSPAIGGPGDGGLANVGVSPTGVPTYFPDQVPSYDPFAPPPTPEAQPEPGGSQPSGQSSSGSQPSNQQRSQPSSGGQSLPPIPKGNITPVNTTPSPAAVAADKFLAQEKSPQNQGQQALLKATTAYLNNPTAPGAQKAFQNTANQVLGLSTKVAPTPTPTAAPKAASKPAQQNPLQYLLSLATKIFGR